MEQCYSSQEHELLTAKYGLNHWRHILEGSEIIIHTDHESLKVYRTKCPMTKRLARFMNEIEHYDPLIIYRPGKLQIIPNALSRMPGVCEGPPADTDRFMAVTETENATANASHIADAPDTADERDTPPPRPRQKYMEIKQYLIMKGELDRAEEELGDLCAEYVVRGENNTLWNKRRDMRCITELEELKDIMERVHSDLGHYGKTATEKAVRQRFEVASDIWKEGRTVLDACVPCQLFKHTPDATETATIHPYPTVDPFEFWEIDFVGPLDETRFGNKYLLTAIDYCTSTALAIPLIKRSAEAAKELMEQIIWTYGAP